MNYITISDFDFKGWGKDEKNVGFINIVSGNGGTCGMRKSKREYFG